jgi:hypothetical protein
MINAYILVGKHVAKRELWRLRIWCEDNIKINFKKLESRDISAGIALGYVLDDRGSRVRFPTGAENFSIHHRVQNGSGAHRGPRALPLGVKRPGREADHSPPSSAEVKECVKPYRHPPVRLHGVVLSQSTGTTLPYINVNNGGSW